MPPARPTALIFILVLIACGSVSAAPPDDIGFAPLFSGPKAAAAARAFRFGQFPQAARLAGISLQREEMPDAERGALEFLRGLALVRAGRRTEAASCFRQLVEAGTPRGLSIHAGWYLGQLLLDGTRPPGPDELKEARILLARVPPSSRFGLQARMLLVRGLLAAGDVDEACRLAELTVQHYAGSFREAGALALLARCRQRRAVQVAKQEGWKKARPLLRQAAGIYRAVAAIWPHLAAGAGAREGLARLRARGIRPAPRPTERLLERARRFGTRLWSRRDLGTLLRIKNLLPPSEKEARFEVDTLYGELSARYRRFRAAYRTLRRVMLHAPTDGLRARAAFGLAGLTARRKPLDAIESYLRIAERWPDTAHAPLGLYKGGEIARRYANQQLAAKTFTSCVEKYPRTAAAARCRWSLAWMELRAGRYEQALKWLEALGAEHGRTSDDGESILAASEEIPIDEDEEEENEEEEEEEEEEDNQLEIEPSVALRAAIEQRRFGERVAYWRARVLGKLGRAEEARAIYRSLAEEHPYGYYALMAAERLHLGNEENKNVQAVAAPELLPLTLGGLLSLALPPAVPDNKPASPAAAVHPDVGASVAYLRMGLGAEALATVKALRRDGMSAEDRRLAARVWAALGDQRRAHRMAPVPWEGGLPGPLGPTVLADARLAYPRAFADQVESDARHEDVPPALLYALMRAESGFHPRASSAAWALGLTQVVRKTAYRTARKIKLRGFRFWHLYRPQIAVRVGSAYLADLLGRFGGQLPLALASYNAGERSVTRWLAQRGELPVDAFIEEIPYAETNRYVRKLLSFYAIYRALYSPSPPDPPLGIDLRIPAEVTQKARKAWTLVRQRKQALEEEKKKKTE